MVFTAGQVVFTSDIGMSIKEKELQVENRKSKDG